MTVASLINFLQQLADKHGDDIEVMKRNINNDGSTTHFSLLLPKTNELKDDTHGTCHKIIEL